MAVNTRRRDGCSYRPTSAAYGHIAAALDQSAGVWQNARPHLFRARLQDVTIVDIRLGPQGRPGYRPGCSRGRGGRPAGGTGCDREGIATAFVVVGLSAARTAVLTRLPKPLVNGVFLGVSGRRRLRAAGL